MSRDLDDSDGHRQALALERIADALERLAYVAESQIRMAKQG